MNKLKKKRNLVINRALINESIRMVAFRHLLDLEDVAAAARLQPGVQLQVGVEAKAMTWTVRCRWTGSLI
jgi:hypothetical protein